MVANRQERGCGRQHHECSPVDRISGRTSGSGKRTKNGSNTSVVGLLVSYSCRSKIVLAVLDRQRSGVKATIWWFCHDHDRSGRSAMIRNIRKEWSAQCDLGLNRVIFHSCSTIPLIRELFKILVTDGVSSATAIHSNLLYMSNTSRWKRFHYIFNAAFFIIGSKDNE